MLECDEQAGAKLWKKKYVSRYGWDNGGWLKATFDCETKLDMKTVWNLPPSMDDLIFDVDLVSRHAFF